MTGDAGFLAVMVVHELRWVRLVEAYVDSALPSVASARVATHLSECWGCSEDAELLRMVKASLRRRPQRVSSLEVARLRRFAERVVTAPPTAGR